MRIEDVYCKVVSAPDFRELLNKIYGTTVYADFSLDGLYIDEPDDPEEGPVDIESLHDRLAKELGVQEVKSIHLDDEEPVNVWLEYSDRDVIRRSDYISSKLWCREDVANELKARGFEGTKEEVDAVINTGELEALDDCTDSDWEIIAHAIWSAQEYGNITPVEK